MEETIRGPDTGESAPRAPDEVEEEPAERPQEFTTVHSHGKHLNRYTDKQALAQRLRRVEGQIRGIQRMVEEDRYCVDILTQIAAARAALDRVGMELTEDHVRGCVSDAIRSGQGEPYIAELMDVINRFVK